jgi:CheY-like chemotaxis protein
VLIVEDEFLIRMDAIDALGAAGYDVLDAGNADEAIAILEERDDVHVIFTDIDMPGSMDGLKLAHFVRDRWPPVKIVATSGHARIADTDLPEGGRFLQKPYTPTQVITTIDRLMNG